MGWEKDRTTDGTGSELRQSIQSREWRVHPTLGWTAVIAPYGLDSDSR
jgi:hypothetical protein